MIDRLRAIVDRTADRGPDTRQPDSLADMGGRSVSPQFRRTTVMKLVMAVLVISSGSLILLGTQTQPALAASISAPDLSVTTDDGNLSAVTINPNITATWSGLNGEVNRVQVILRVSNQSDQRVLRTPSIHTRMDCDNIDHPDCGEGSGSMTFDFGSRDLNLFNDSIYTFVDDTETKPTPDEFTVADGETNSTTVYLRVEVKAYDADLNTLGSYEEDLSFTVTHTNAASNTSAEGSIDTGTSG